MIWRHVSKKSAPVAEPIIESYRSFTVIVMATPKILVVDDYENLRKLVATFLVRLNYTVLQAADGRTAIEIAIAEAPKFILLDLLLPDMSGIDVARQLREILHFKHTPIVGWSGNPIPRQQALLRTSLTDCLLKPVAPRVLQALIERFVPNPKH
jgi:two-component system response regulator ResD